MTDPSSKLTVRNELSTVRLMRANFFLSFLLNSTSYGEHASWSYDLAWFPKYEVKGSDQYYKFNSEHRH